MTSRPDPEIAKLCETFASEAIYRLQGVPTEEAGSDIKTYLKAKLPKLTGRPELDELGRRADGLFIYAATAVKYLTLGRSITTKEQIEKLRRLLSKTDESASASDATFLIDQLYRQIMYDALSEYTEDQLARRLLILHTFLCTAERASTSVAAALVPEGDEEISKAVADDLHAVLYIQGGCVLWYHASFPDFIFNSDRSNFSLGEHRYAYSCDEAAHHNLLGESCFRVMKMKDTGLRFNICDIPSSFLLDSDHAEALSEKLENNIDPVLRYSSQHWAHHLPPPKSANISDLLGCISDFLEIRVLFWIEAMNLLGFRTKCSLMLQHTRQWVLKVGI